MTYFCLNEGFSPPRCFSPTLWALSSPAQRRRRVLSSYISSDAAHAWLMDVAAFTRSIKFVAKRKKKRKNYGSSCFSCHPEFSFIAPLPTWRQPGDDAIGLFFPDFPATSVRLSSLSRVVTGKDTSQRLGGDGRVSWSI